MAIPEKIKKLANDIRTKIYGKDVRESLAKGIEEAGNIADETQARQNELETQFQSVLDETTDKDFNSAPEIKAARVSSDGTNHNNLKERLDKEHQEVTTQLAQMEQKKVDRSELQQKEEEIKFYLGNQLDKIGNMTPKEAFATLQDLENTYPNGAEGVYLVQENGHWYYWNLSTNQWTDGGLYQALPWDEFMTEHNEPWEVA